MKANRDDQFMDASKQAMHLTPPEQPLIDQLPGDLREVLGELRALAAVSDLCRLNVIARLDRIKAWCLEHRVNWERFCDEALPKCRKTINHYLHTRETFGDGTYEAVIELTTKAERAEAHRLFKAGTIRHEGGAIVIGRKKIPNDPKHVHQIVETIREAFAQRDAAEADAQRERELRAKDRARAEDRERELVESAKALRAELDKWQGAKVPDGLVSEQEKQLWAQLSTWWSQFHAALLLFAHHREQGLIADAALAAFQGLLTTMRDELAETVQQIEADLQLERPTLRRVR